MKFSAKIRKRINTTLKILLVVLVYVVLFFQLKNYDWSIWQHDNLFAEHWLFLGILVFVMMFANWGVESVKWQYLMQKVENIRLWTALKAVFVGMAISIFTPNRVGDYLGRVFILSRGDRLDGIVATIVGNLAQLLVTLVMGSFGLIFFANEINTSLLHLNEGGVIALKILAILIDIGILYIYFNTAYLEHAFMQRFKLHRYPVVKHLHMLGRFSKPDLAKILLMSFGRYMIYATQYYLLFKAFGMPLQYGEGLLLVSVLFFTLTIVPTVAVAELGVRGVLSVYVVEWLFANSIGSVPLIAASSALWMINIALPALIGGLFVVDLKFVRTTNNIQNE